MTTHDERILVVCTANQCRSPLAAALLARRLTASGAPAAVDSAGLFGGGQPVPDDVAALAPGFGVSLQAHRSRAVSAEELVGADLVLAMGREHARELVLLSPARFPVIFTLPELVRRGTAVGSRRTGQPLADWLSEAARGRRHADLLGASPEDDVPDPMGGPPEAYEEMAVTLAGLVEALVRVAWPPGPASGDRAGRSR